MIGTHLVVPFYYSIHLQITT